MGNWTGFDLMVGIGIAALVLKEILHLFRADKRLSRIEEKINILIKQSDDLHKWHDHDDADGVKVWWVRRSLEEAIKDLSKNIAKQTEVFQSLIFEMRQKTRE